MSELNSNLLTAASWSCLPALLGVVAYPMYRVWVTGKLWSPVLTMWLLLMGWSLFYGIIAPACLSSYLHDQEVWDHFVNGKGVGAMLFMGWPASALYCGMVWVARETWHMIGKRLR